MRAKELAAILKVLKAAKVARCEIKGSAIAVEFVPPDNERVDTSAIGFQIQQDDDDEEADDGYVRRRQKGSRR